MGANAKAKVSANNLTSTPLVEMSAAYHEHRNHIIAYLCSAVRAATAEGAAWSLIVASVRDGLVSTRAAASATVS